MSKLLKRLLAVVSVVAVLLALGVVILFYMANRRPSWIPREVLDPAARAAAAARVEAKLRSAHSLAADSQSAETRARHTNQPLPTTRPSLQVSFTEEEINAFFDKWSNWRERYATYVTDAGVALHDNKLTLYGIVKELDKAISVQFEPRVDEEGGVRLALDGVYAGYVPLPQSLFEKYRRPLVLELRAALPALQRGARIDRDGSANREAVDAAMGKLLLDLLQDKPGEPIAFLPLVDSKRHVPLKLTQVEIEDKTLTLTLVSLTPKERDELLARIREPYGSATASTD